MFKVHPMQRVRRIHFVGIGGSGMSGIAEVLLSEGYLVSGSDMSIHTPSVSRLVSMGATIYEGHAEHHVEGAEVLVISSAITKDNLELRAARALGIPIVPRAQMLAELMRLRFGIAVAGTHGKTTTTSMITAILAKASWDPSYVVGGLIHAMGAHAGLGRGEHLVVEADESDASFLYLNPMLSVITNIDADHMAQYEHDFSKLERAFLDFIERLPFYGRLVFCLDDPVLRSLIPKISRPYRTYGFSFDADIQSIAWEKQGWRSLCSVQRPHRPPLCFSLNLPGKHNVLNAMAAITVADILGVPDAAICEALSEFSGVGRRMQRHGTLSFSGKNVELLDDYGHHPAEIFATWTALGDVWPDRRKVMVFQPHRYTRTRDLFDDFCQTLAQVPHLILLPIYSASEDPIEGYDSHALAEGIARVHGIRPRVCASEPSSWPRDILSELCDGDVLLLQGAGNVGGLSKILVDQLSASEEIRA